MDAEWACGAGFQEHWNDALLIFVVPVKSCLSAALIEAATATVTACDSCCWQVRPDLQQELFDALRELDIADIDSNKAPNFLGARQHQIRVVGCLDAEVIPKCHRLAAKCSEAVSPWLGGICAF